MHATKTGIVTIIWDVLGRFLMRFTYRFGTLRKTTQGGEVHC